MRTGDVRASAEDAGIDHTTAYARRRAHAEFSGDWEAALEAHVVRVKAREAEELAALSGVTPPPAPSHRGEGSSELVGTGSQLKRAGHDRWSQRKERLFFDELAATANVKRWVRAG